MPDSLSKIGALIASLEELKLHLGRRDLAVGGTSVNAQLYFSVANACLRNRAVLLYGGMGANKTTLVNLLGSSFMGLPLEDVENTMVSGHPEQTEEKVVGFLDPRQWSRTSGDVDVLWTPWAKSRWKVINEINRFPSGKQNLFLEVIQKRKISYAGQVLDRVEDTLGATDVTGGTHTDVHLVAPLGNQAEGLVKRGDVLDAAHGHLQSLADPGKRLLGKPMMLTLDIQQDLNERTFLAVMIVDDLIYFRDIHGCRPYLLPSLRPVRNASAPRRT